MRKIVFDIETRNTFEDVLSDSPVDLDLALLSIWDSETDEYSSYLQEDLEKLWPIIDSADLLIGFNSDYFDIPLLNKYYPGNLTDKTSLDIMKELQKVLGHRIGLDAVAQATLGIGKNSNGLQSIVWWRAGEIDKIRQYCEQDVKVTKEIYEYALKHNELKFHSRSGKTKTVPLDTSTWPGESEAETTQVLSLF